MTNKDASFLLGACRPNGADSTDPEFSEALAQAGRDPALKEWLEDQRRFDAVIAARLQSMPAPGDLRSRILTGGRVSQPESGRFGGPLQWFTRQRIWAIAAMAVVFLGVGLMYYPWHRSDRWEDQALAALAELVSGRESFDAQSPHVADLQQWLRRNGSPGGGALPSGVERLASLGCKTISWNGHPISLICFHGPGEEMVHLAMTGRAGLENPPPEGPPVYGVKDGWQTASWSQGEMAMMLITKAPESELRALLAVAGLN